MEENNIKKKTVDNLNSKILLFAILLLISLFVLMVYWISTAEKEMDPNLVYKGLFIGFFAQLIDGAIGMAYGIISNTMLLHMGFSPVNASSMVHVTEVFTTAASGLSHWKFGNVSKQLLIRLIVPGVIGGLLGVLFLNYLKDVSWLKLIVSIYLLFIGFYIIIKAFRKAVVLINTKGKKVKRLALLGGFIDAVGGGGWGPVVTTTLLASSNHSARKVIGSVNSAEFFITIVTGFSFSLLVGVSNWEIVLGMIVGSLVMSPISAKITSMLPVKFVMIFAGFLVVFLSSISIIKFFI